MGDAHRAILPYDSRFGVRLHAVCSPAPYRENPVEFQNRPCIIRIKYNTMEDNRNSIHHTTDVRICTGSHIEDGPRMQERSARFSVTGDSDAERPLKTDGTRGKRRKQFPICRNEGARLSITEIQGKQQGRKYTWKKEGNEQANPWPPEKKR